MIGETATYVGFALGLSVLVLGILIPSVWQAARAYHTYHDRVAGISLALNLVALVMAFGLFVSALGLHLQVGILSLAGVSIARGALLVLALVLLVAEVKGRDRLGIGGRR